jgi:hypothetical protein
MKKTAFLCGCLLLSLVYQSRAQDEEQNEFGQVSKADLLMKKYAPDTSAAAVILSDKGEVSAIDWTKEKRHVRIKLIKRSAFKEWANVTLYIPNARPFTLKAATYVLDSDGQTVRQVPVSDKDIVKQRYNKYIDAIKFTFPGVKEGAVVEYTYTITYRDARIPEWTFQYSIPVKHSEYKVTSAYSYTPSLRGSLSFSHTEANKFNTRLYVIDNIPAFREEPFMPHENVYRSVLTFRSAYRSWDNINESLLDDVDFGKVLTGHPYLKNIADGLVDGVTNDQEKIKRISDYVRTNIAWNGVTDFYADEPMKVLQAKTGTSGDMNLMLGSLLKKAGFQVRMVLISTRDHGVIDREAPSFAQFNDVICLVHSGTDSLLLDATEKQLPYNLLPLRCLNYGGLVIREGVPEWIAVRPRSRSRISVNSEFNILDTDLLHGSFKYTRDGYAAHNARQEYYQKGETEFVKDFMHQKKAELEKSEIQNMNDPYAPVQENYSVNISGHVTRTEDHLYLDPYLALREEAALFTEEKRLYPVDFIVPVEKTFVCSIVIPEGYVVDELPASRVYTLPDKSTRYMFNIGQTGNKIAITSRLIQNKTLFMPDEYPALKEFYASIVSKKSELIVLKKTTP